MPAHLAPTVLLQHLLKVMAQMRLQHRLQFGIAVKTAVGITLEPALDKGR